MIVSTVNYDELKVVSAYEDNELVWAEVAEHGRMAYIDIGKDELFFVRKYGVCPDPKLPYEEYERELCHDVSLVLQDRAKEGNPVDIAGMHHITEANPATRYLYDQVYESENSMHFVEYDDAPWEDIGISKEEFERQVDEDILKFHLADVIEKDTEDCLYTCYGNLASVFSIDEERKELKYNYVPVAPVQSEKPTIHLTSKQQEALKILSNALWNVRELGSYGEGSAQFNKEILSGPIGKCFALPIEKIVDEIDYTLESAEIVKYKASSKEKSPLVR